MMKKKIFTLFALLFAIVLSCAAQEENRIQFFNPKFGIRAGYNLTNVTKIMDLNPNSWIIPHWKSAANFGFIVDFHSKSCNSLRFEQTHAEHPIIMGYSFTVVRVSIFAGCTLTSTLAVSILI